MFLLSFNISVRKTRYFYAFFFISTLLMADLAVWDTISLLQDGVADIGLKTFGIKLASYHSIGCKVRLHLSFGR